MIEAHDYSLSNTLINSSSKLLASNIFSSQKLLEYMDVIGFYPAAAILAILRHIVVLSTERRSLDRAKGWAYGRDLGCLKMSSSTATVLVAVCNTDAFQASYSPWRPR